MGNNYACAATKIVASGAIGDTNKPILIYGYGVQAGPGGSAPFFNNGDQTVGMFVPGPVVGEMMNIETFETPVMFPTGCYVSFDSNTLAVSVFYKQNLVSS
jgi:hypothetical protein